MPGQSDSDIGRTGKRSGGGETSGAEFLSANSDGLTDNERAGDAMLLDPHSSPGEMEAIVQQRREKQQRDDAAMTQQQRDEMIRQAEFTPAASPAKAPAAATTAAAGGSAASAAAVAGEEEEAGGLGQQMDVELPAAADGMDTGAGGDVSRVEPVSPAHTPGDSSQSGQPAS